MNDEFRLPAEWEQQEAIQLTWPHAGTDWKETLVDVNTCYVSIAKEISKREDLWIVTPEPQKVERLLRNNLPDECLDRISYYKMPTNDTWARDHGFISLVSSTAGCCRKLLDFRFNAWGGKFQATLDNEINHKLVEMNYHLSEDEYVDNLDFELEGGSIDSDGKGTILTTAQCNLNPNRRGDPTLYNNIQEHVEEELKRRLHVQRILWLHYGGLEHDDTDGHIDTLARFCPNDTIVYGEGCSKMEEELRSFRTMDGKPYQLISLPPYHVNFLIMNDAILVPFYENKADNTRAKETLERIFPDREVIGIDCCILLTQNGSLHCCTMQFPSKG